MSTVAVEVRDLWKIYGGVEALKGISLDVSVGETVGLLGPNGAGKSTLCNIVAGIIKPSRGVARVFGLDVARESDRVKEIVSLQTQEDGLNPMLTGIENAEFYGGLYGLSRRDVRARLEELQPIHGLGMDDLRRQVKTYSGGMRRRLSLAIALLKKPKLLILDEPTSGLDVASRRALWESLEGFGGEGVSIILATHNMEEAHRLSDRVAIIDRGRLIAFDQPDRLIARFGPKSTVSLKIQVQGDLEAVREAIATRLGVDAHIASRRDGLINIYTEDPDRILPKSITLAVEAGARVVEARVREPTLEDVFIALTGRRLSS